MVLSELFIVYFWRKDNVAFIINKWPYPATSRFHQTRSTKRGFEYRTIKRFWASITAYYVYYLYVTLHYCKNSTLKHCYTYLEADMINLSTSDVFSCSRKTHSGNIIRVPHQETLFFRSPILNCYFIPKGVNNVFAAGVHYKPISRIT